MPLLRHFFWSYFSEIVLYNSTSEKTGVFPLFWCTYSHYFHRLNFNLFN